MEDKDYINWCLENNLNYHLVSSFWEYQNYLEYLDYLNSEV